MMMGMRLLAGILLASQFVVCKASSKTGQCGKGGCCGTKDRVWIVASGDNFGTFDRVDENNALNGWGKAVVLAACRAAGIKCRVIFAPTSDCIENHDPPNGWQQHIATGRGLANEHFDACAGFYPTAERRDQFIFSTGFAVQFAYSLWYLDNAGGVPSDDVSSLTISFGVSGPADETCLRRYFDRLGITFTGTVKPTYPQTGQDQYQTAVDLIKTNDADLVFLSVPRTFFSSDNGHFVLYDTDNDTPGTPGDGSLNDLGDIINCSQGPAGLIARPDRWEFIEEFNLGLQLIFDNGEYKKICADPFFNTPVPTFCVDV